MSLVRKPALYGTLILLILIGGGGYTYWWSQQSLPQITAATTNKTPEEADIAVRFVMEGYDLIQANHWKNAPESELSQLFLLSLNKAANVTETLSVSDRTHTAQTIARVFSGHDAQAKKKLAVDTLTIALANLAPVGRAQLLSSQAQQDLNNTVTNVNPNTNLYQTLGLEDGAATATVAKAYEEKKTAIEATSSPTKAQDLEKLTYAHNVLTDTDQKNTYDTTRAEPTIFSRKVNASTLYVYISKMSPTTQGEFERTLKRTETDSKISSLILDMRGNIGGDLSFAATSLGLFLGPNQFAFDLYVHGAYEAQRTIGIGKMAGLAHIREMAVLTDAMSQSTAEVITAAIKRGRLGIVVGGTTRGWGSIEKVFQMQTQLDPKQTYGILMVVALTVRDDGQPIEGSGVTPDVAISDPQWESQLSQHFFSSDLISAVRSTVAEAPKK